jgi:hypothetical protein
LSAGCCLDGLAIHSALLAGLVLAALLAALTGLSTWPTLLLLAGLVLAALLAALTALLRVSLALLVALRIVLFIRHWGRSPVDNGNPRPTTRQPATPIGVPGFAAAIPGNSLKNNSKSTNLMKQSRALRCRVNEAVAGFAAGSSPC